VYSLAQPKGRPELGIAHLLPATEAVAPEAVNAAFVVFVTLMFWGCVFMVFFTAQGTGPVDFFLGRLEPLPNDLGIWRESGAAAESNLVREERYVLPQSDSNANYLLHQVRYLDCVTGDIVGVEAERRVRRRRIRNST
jgi:hypothetical protein